MSHYERDESIGSDDLIDVDERIDLPFDLGHTQNVRSIDIHPKPRSGLNLDGVNTGAVFWQLMISLTFITAMPYI